MWSAEDHQKRCAPLRITLLFAKLPFLYRRFVSVARQLDIMPGSEVSCHSGEVSMNKRP